VQNARIPGRDERSHTSFRDDGHLDWGKVERAIEKVRAQSNPRQRFIQLTPWLEAVEQRGVIQQLENEQTTRPQDSHNLGDIRLDDRLPGHVHQDPGREDEIEVLVWEEFQILTVVDEELTLWHVTVELSRAEDHPLRNVNSITGIEVLREWASQPTHSTSKVECALELARMIEPRGSLHCTIYLGLPACPEFVQLPTAILLVAIREHGPEWVHVCQCFPVAFVIGKTSPGHAPLSPPNLN
jgi:hypothetical protein